MSRFLIDRRIFDNEVWSDVPCFRLFFYLVGMAAYQDGQKIGGLELKKGQYIRSYRKLQEDLTYNEDNTTKQYSTRTIKRCVDVLVDKNMVSIEECSLGTVFTLVNYEHYQDFNTVESAKKIETEKHQRNTSETIITKQTKQINKTTPLPPKGEGEGFQRFWSIYPKKQDKANSQTIWRRKKLEAIAPAIIDAVLRFTQSSQWQRDEGRYIPKPSNFLQGENWNDEIAAVSHQSKAKTRAEIMLEAWKTGKSFIHKLTGKEVSFLAIEPFNHLSSRVTEENPTAFRSKASGNIAFFNEFEVIDDA